MPEEVKEICWICHKEKGQPPERCNGHYETPHGLGPVECDSEEGITIGLLDTIMTCCNALKGRDLSHAQVVEALKDLRSNEELRMLMFKGVMGFNYEKIRDAYEVDALGKAMECPKNK